MKKILMVVLSFVTLFSMNMSMAHAQKETLEEKSVAFRQGVFQSLSWKMGQLGMAQAAGEAQAFKKHAADLAYLTSLITEGFIPNSLVGESHAMPSVWDDAAGFVEAAQKMRAMANEIASEDYDMTTFDARRFGREGCGGCHKNFKERD
jgi:cytochrome c556